MLSDFSNILERITNWILDSGIHSRHVFRNADAFYESFHSGKKKYSFLYCEITGYAINFFLNLYKIKQEENFLNTAKKAGNFLVRFQAKEGNLRGAIPWNVNEDGKAHHLYYSFDTGVCLNGLADLYMVTGEKQYLQSAVMAADWLIGQAQNDDGSYRAVFDRIQNVFNSFMLLKYWSGDRGCLHIKNIRGLIKTYKISRNEEYLKSIRKTMSWSKKMQDEDGSFPATQGKDFIFTHSHCYAIEGIISAFIFCNDTECRRQILAAADWLLKTQNRDGSFYDYYHLPNIFLRLRLSDSRVKRIYHGTITVDSQKIIRIKRTDATSQAARILVFVYIITQNSRYKKAALKALDFINKMQSRSPNKNENGGICFGRLDFMGIKRKSKLYTSWSGMFAANAMYLLGQIQDNRNIDPDHFNEILF